MHQPDWPDLLLAKLGRIAMLTHAYKRIDDLEPVLQDDVRSLVGWTLKEDEVKERGEAVRDRWIVLGERTTVEKKLHARATWLLGERSERTALMLQFAFQGRGWDETLVIGTAFEGTLVYWPSAYPQRALVGERHGTPTQYMGHLPGAATLEDFLEHVGQALARQPWLDSFACVVRDVVPAVDGDRWLVQDSTGRALPLVTGQHWGLLAMAGGAPVDLAGIWNGNTIDPLGVVVGGRYRAIVERVQ